MVFRAKQSYAAEGERSRWSTDQEWGLIYGAFDQGFLTGAADIEGGFAR